MDRVLAGRYELEVPLGRGASGEVWRGNDMATHRPVAVKLVELSQIDDPGLLAETISRFRREAMVISGIRHPNIVAAVDAGRIGNQLFMVMELAPGISLASMMDERGARGMGLFPVSSVFRMADQVCAGLAAAHEAGVVHRDIKPSNLMVTPSLGVKIVDFGIARLLSDNSPRLTLPAQTVGTVAYMSPEQAQGLDVDGRGDLYSLGCLLYQLLCGRPPFFSSLPSALLMMHVMDRPVPLANIRPDLPPEVCQLVSDLIEKERDARPATAQQVIARIAEIQRKFGDEVPEFEADRQTVRAGDYRGVGGGGFGDFTPDAGRSPTLTTDRMSPFSPPETMAAEPWTPAGGQPFRPSMPFPAPVVPPQPRPIRSVPQAVARTGGPGTGGGPAVPNWPVLPPRRRRTRWVSVVSTLITAAIVAGAGAYYWISTHQVLKISHVAVTPENPTVGCNGTENLVGTISTNGHSGPIDYEWVLNGKSRGVVQATAGTDSTVLVTLAWNFSGRGTGDNIAKLVIVSPQAADASITFPYSCPIK
jgi:serine/threonine protein kinase